MKRKPRVAVQHCDTCRRWARDFNPARGWEFVCTSGHRPNFYLPKSPDDTTYGYKRRCEDWLKRREQ